MAQRQQQPIARSVLIVGLSTLLVSCHFASDLHSPLLFIFKAILPIATWAMLTLLVIYSITIKRKWLFIATAYAILINAVFLLPQLKTISPLSEIQKKERIRVATFSTLTRTENVKDIVNFATSETPDFLCLQEVALKDREYLIQQITPDYPYHLQNNSNQITFSRHPLVQSHDAGYFLAGDVRHSKLGTLTIINAHMPRPYFSLGIELNWQKLLDFIDNKSSMVICGDLNLTPNNALYDLLIYRYNLTDSLLSGYGLTFPNAQRKSALLGPLIRIDYILSRHLEPIKTRTINASELSDHRAVVSDFVVKKQTP